VNKQGNHSLTQSHSEDKISIAGKVATDIRYQHSAVVSKFTMSLKVRIRVAERSPVNPMQGVISQLVHRKYEYVRSADEHRQEAACFHMTFQEIILVRVYETVIPSADRNAQNC
jgi:hypothetical protein